MTHILGIETSCDETAASVVSLGHQVLSNVICSQHALHEKYQGVVPEIASRAHVQRILPVICQALEEAKLGMQDISAIAVGNRPGLIGSLLVGVSAAQALAWSTGKPLIGVDHVQAHLYAGALAKANGAGDEKLDDKKLDDKKQDVAQLTYPALGLVVSGGHTSLYDVKSPTQMQLLGKTIDDAVGEAYDKAAVILNLGYPGGPKLDKLASAVEISADDLPVILPRSMLGKTSLDFSFSGLKTALLYAVCGKPQGRQGKTTFQRNSEDLTQDQQAGFAHAFQEAAVDVLIKKIDRAIEQQTAKGQLPTCLLIGGGVSANSLLRQRCLALGQQHQLPVHLPAMDYCLDNAAMIAGLAHHFFLDQAFDTLDLPAMASGSIR